MGNSDFRPPERSKGCPSRDPRIPLNSIEFSRHKAPPLGFYSKRETGLFQGCFRAVSGLLQKCTRAVSGLFQGCFRAVSGLLQNSLEIREFGHSNPGNSMESNGFLGFRLGQLSDLSGGRKSSHSHSFQWNFVKFDFCAI